MELPGPHHPRLPRTTGPLLAYALPTRCPGLTFHVLLRGTDLLDLLLLGRRYPRARGRAARLLARSGELGLENEKKKTLFCKRRKRRKRREIVLHRELAARYSSRLAC
eukprot:2581058-Rhodomonas_salina.2